MISTLKQKGKTMTEEIKLKKKIKDTRVHLSDKFIRGLLIKDKPYSVGDDTVIGLRIFVFTGGSKVFWFCYRERDTRKKYKERLENFPTINCVQARKSYCTKAHEAYK